MSELAALSDPARHDAGQALLASLPVADKAGRRRRLAVLHGLLGGPRGEAQELARRLEAPWQLGLLAASLDGRLLEAIDARLAPDDEVVLDFLARQVTVWVAEKWKKALGRISQVRVGLDAAPGRLVRLALRLPQPAAPRFGALLVASVRAAGRGAALEGIRGVRATRSAALVAASAALRRPGSLGTIDDASGLVAWLLREANHPRFDVGVAAGRALGALLAALDAEGRLETALTPADAPQDLSGGGKGALAEIADLLGDLQHCRARRHRSLVGAAPHLTRLAPDGPGAALREAARGLVAWALAAAPPEDAQAPARDEHRYARASMLFALGDLEPTAGVDPRAVIEALPAIEDTYVLVGLAVACAEVSAAGPTHPGRAAWAPSVDAALDRLAAEAAGRLGSGPDVGDDLRRLETLAAAALARPGDRERRPSHELLPALAKAPGPRGAWARTWSAAVTLCGELGCWPAPPARADAPWSEALAALDRVAGGSDCPRAAAYAGAFRWLYAPPDDGTFGAHVELLEAAVDSLLPASNGLLRHPDPATDALRLAVVGELGRAAAHARARAELSPEAGRWAKRRLDGVVARAFGVLAGQLHELGHDAERWASDSVTVQRELLQSLERLIEDRPELWEELIRLGDVGEAPLVAHPAIRHGYFGLLAAGAHGPKALGDFTDFCIEQLVAGQPASAAPDRVGLTLRVLDRVVAEGQPHRLDKVLERLEGRAMDPVTRGLAALYRRLGASSAPASLAGDVAARLEASQSADRYVRDAAAAWRLLARLGEAREAGPLDLVEAARDAIRGAAHAADGTGHAELAADWAAIGRHRFLAPGEAPLDGQLGRLPLVTATARLELARSLADRIAAAAPQLQGALGPRASTPWAAALEALAARLRQPHEVAVSLLDEPTPARALATLRTPGIGQDGSPGGLLLRRLGYESLVRGFACVEALTSPARSPAPRRLDRLVAAIYGLGLQGAAVLAAAVFVGLALLRAPGDAAGDHEACAIPLRYTAAVLLAPSVVAALGPLLPLLVGAWRDARGRDRPPVPLLAGRLAMPRLWAANLLGVTFLGLSDEGWSQMLQAGPGGWTAAALFALLALAYMAFEVQRVSASPRRVHAVPPVAEDAGSVRRGAGAPAQLPSSLLRALRVWLLGLNQCIVLVVGLQLYAGPVMRGRAVGDVGAEALVRCVGSAGWRIYPSALVVWTAGALFFGLLLQVLWEEKSLSEGLD